MKAIIIKEDRSLSWSDVADPVIREDEVLVKVAYAAVNRADLMQREGCFSLLFFATFVRFSLPQLLTKRPFSLCPCRRQREKSAIALRIPLHLQQQI